MTLVAPRLITPAQWAQQNSWSRAKSYRLVKQLPNEIKVELGGRVYVNEQALTAWLAAGGDRAAS